MTTALKLLNRIERHRRIAFNSYQRYSWRPATTTGRNDLDRWQKAESAVDEALSELRTILAKEADE